MTSEVEPKREICPDCGWEIDLDWCWCGSHRIDHDGYGGHDFRFMGCTCGYANAEQMKKPKDQT
jgi:hypothetical protein